MRERQLRLALGPGPICGGCEWHALCGAAELDEACHPGWGDPSRGGVNVLHPNHPDTAAHLREVGGAGFDDVVAQPQAPFDLPPFVHRIRPRRALRGQLSDPLYCVGPGVVARQSILSCRRFRQLTGLGRRQRVGLLLFGEDEMLERLWVRRLVLAPQIAVAGYDFCVAPSYSNYIDRPRTEFLFNAKRSLVYFKLLQQYGVPTIPRVAWVIEHDAKRFAWWLNANPAVECVALDLASSSDRDWHRELCLLAVFDMLTDRRLSYLVHGPAVHDRCLDLYDLTGPERMHITNSRAMAMKPTVAGAPFRDRFASQRAVIENARCFASLRALLLTDAA